MKLKWTVVDPHSGLKEDAPANMAGGGNIAGLGVGPQGEPGIRKKKKREVNRMKRSKLVLIQLR